MKKKTIVVEIFIGLDFVQDDRKIIDLIDMDFIGVENFFWVGKKLNPEYEIFR